MTRSTPYMSSSGKPRPQSTTIMSLPYSSTVMFLPISFRPPSGMIFSFSANKITTPLMIQTYKQNKPQHSCADCQNNLLSRKFRREGKCERKPSGCPFTFNHPPQRQNCKIMLQNLILQFGKASAWQKRPEGTFFDKLMKKRARPPLRVRKTGKWVSSVCGLCKNAQVRQKAAGRGSSAPCRRDGSRNEQPYPGKDGASAGPVTRLVLDRGCPAARRENCEADHTPPHDSAGSIAQNRRVVYLFFGCAPLGDGFFR